MLVAMPIDLGYVLNGDDEIGTYTPMTDCFFGASLMMAAGDQLIKGLRGDVDEEKEWYERKDVDGGSTFENLCSGKGFEKEARAWKKKPGGEETGLALVGAPNLADRLPEAG